MIVPSMTEADLIKEIDADLAQAFKYADSKDKPFRRFVIKSSRFPVYADTDYVSPRKNRWIILFEAKNKSMVGDRSLLTFVVTYSTMHGVYAILVSFINGAKVLTIFPPHFFSRYAERMRLSKTGLELIKHYFKFNNNYMYAGTADTVTGTTKEGIALGIQTECYNFLFKTFVSFEMLKGEQIENYLKSNSLREELHEEEIARSLKQVR